MLKGILIYAVGVYTGMYVAQNYDVPVVDRPEILIQRFKVWIEKIDRDYRKRDE